MSGYIKRRGLNAEQPDGAFALHACPDAQTQCERRPGGPHVEDAGPTPDHGEQILGRRCARLEREHLTDRTAGGSTISSMSPFLCSGSEISTGSLNDGLTSTMNTSPSEIPRV